MHRRNHIGCVIVSELASIAAYRVFEPPSGQNKYYEIVIYFYAKQEANFKF